MTNSELLANLFDDHAHPLRASYSAWLSQSKGFKAFTETYLSKIKSKIKSAPSLEYIRDLQTELAIAAQLLTDGRIQLEYESYGRKQRGPDLTGLFRTVTTFNVETTRIRPFTETLEERLIEVICEKLGQMPAHCINIIAIETEVAVSAEVLQQHLKTLKLLAEGRSERIYKFDRFVDTKDFFRQYSQLSAVFIFQQGVQWLNPSSRQPLPKDLHQVLKKLL